MTADFVILSTQRTGSTWVVDTLDRVDGCECHGELFLPEPVETRPVAGCADYERYIERRDRHASGVRPFSVFSYLDGLYARPGAVGFKLMYGQLRRYPEILLYLKARGLRVVHLVRENQLDRVISGTLAEKSGRAHDIAGADPTRDTRVRLDPERTVSQIRKAERYVRWMSWLLSAARLSSTRVAYEALLSQPEAFGQLTTFLSLGDLDHPPGSVLIKRQQRPRRESIENYAEIEKALSASGYGRFLREP